MHLTSGNILIKKELRGCGRYVNGIIWWVFWTKINSPLVWLLLLLMEPYWYYQANIYLGFFPPKCFPVSHRKATSEGACNHRTGREQNFCQLLTMTTMVLIKASSFCCFLLYSNNNVKRPCLRFFTRLFTHILPSDFTVSLLLECLQQTEQEQHPLSVFVCLNYVCNME